MEFNEIKKGMILMKDDPPPYMFIINKYNNGLDSIGFYGYNIDIEFISEVGWNDYFRDDITQDDVVTKSKDNIILLRKMISDIFELEILYYK